MGVLEEVLDGLRVEDSVVELVVDVLDVHHCDGEAAPTVQLGEPLGSARRRAVGDHDVVDLLVVVPQTRGAIENHVVGRGGCGGFQQREATVAHLDLGREHPAFTAVPDTTGVEEIDRGPVVRLDRDSINRTIADREQPQLVIPDHRTVLILNLDPVEENHIYNEITGIRIDAFRNSDDELVGPVVDPYRRDRHLNGEVVLPIPGRPFGDISVEKDLDFVVRQRGSLAVSWFRPPPEAES